MLLKPAQDSDDFTEEKLTDRFNIYRSRKVRSTNSFLEDVKAGLTSGKKYLLPKYFYDNAGSQLFEKICLTDEYYLTRTEESILENSAGRIFKFAPGTDIISELGSGNSKKTEILLHKFQENKTKILYTPIDISDISVSGNLRLTQKYEKLYVTGIISYYEEGLEFVCRKTGEPKIILFLGSSIGNFTTKESVIFLSNMRCVMTVEDMLIIGFDMVKSKSILEKAYNDKDGITSEFNLNLLARINKELGADFDLNLFCHEAIYNQDYDKIEMYLKAVKDTVVNIPGINQKIKFSKGELIHTENSHKFTMEKISTLAEKTGFKMEECFSDDKEYFTLCIFKLNVS